MSLPLSAIPKPITRYTTSLAAKILSTDTSLTLESATDDAGNAISGVVGLTIDNEDIIGTKSGTSVTGCLRGVDPQDGTTERTALKADHQRGASVKVTTSPFLSIVYRLVNGTEGFPNKLSYASAPTFTTGTDIITKTYADGLALASAVQATTSAVGYVELPTAAELTSGAATGGTGAGLAATPALTAAQIQSGSWLYAVEDGTGSDDTYTASLTPALTAYAAGQIVLVKFTVANTGACTVNLNSLGAKDIQKYVAGALAALETGDIVANQTCLLYYDGTRFVLINPSATLPTTALLSEMATFFGSTDMTGAEAEDLTDGGATTLHYHAKSNGTTSKDASDASGTQNIAHGLGVAPKKVRLVANSLYETAGNSTAFAQTVYNGTTQSSISKYIISGPSATLATTFTLNTANANATQSGVVTVDATNIIITWTKTGSPTGTYQILWEAEL